MKTERRPTIDFLKSTIFGGLLFLLPLGLILFLLGHIFAITKSVLQPLTDALVRDTDARIGMLSALAIVSLVLVAFIVGLFARTRHGKKVMHRIENSVLGNIPQYRMLRAMGKTLAQLENNDQATPALISIEGGWQLGYVLANLQDGWFTVFLPQAPTPLSGNVIYLPGNRVRLLTITMIEAMAVVTAMGVTSGEVLKGIDLNIEN